MKLLLSAFAALLLAVAPNLAHAADISTIDCIAKTIPEPTRAALREEGRLATTTSDEHGPGLVAAMGAFRTAVATCTKRYKWSPAAAEAATTYTISSYVLEGIVAAGEREGISLALLEKALADLTPEQRAALEQGEGYEAMVDSLRKNGFEIGPDPQARIIGAMTGAVQSRNRARADFIAS